MPKYRNSNYIGSFLHHVNVQSVFIKWHFKICVTSLLFSVILCNFHRYFCTLGKLMLPLATLNWVIMWRCIRIRKCLLSKPFIPGGSSAVTEKQCRREVYVRIPTSIALSTWLLNRSGKQEVCEIHVRRNVNVEHVHTEEFVGAAGTSQAECATFNTADWGLNQHCTEYLSWRLVVSAQNEVGPATVERWKSKMLRLCVGEESAAGKHSGYLEYHMVLRWSTLPLGWSH